MTANRLGLLIGAVFGTIYVVVNAGLLSAPVGLLLQVVSAAAFVAGVVPGLLLRGGSWRGALRGGWEQVAAGE